MIEKHLIINKGSIETRVALIENNRLSEVFIERDLEKGIVGNIYKGIITRVMPGMNAAFVDIGQNKSAFLFGGDSTHKLDQSSSIDLKEKVEQKPISETLSQGQHVLVQVSKEPLGTKGPRITRLLTLAGRYLVYIPNYGHVAISRKIEDEKERNRLKKTLEKLIPGDKAGVIARTAAQMIPKESLTRDYKMLEKQWAQIMKKAETCSAPKVLYEDLGMVERLIRDLYDEELQSIIVDNYNLFQKIQLFITENIPEAFRLLKMYHEKKPIFDHYDIEVDIARALSRRVDLPSGGYLIIEQTEALTSFDVNTGRYVGKENAQQTILHTNLEAVEKSVEQLRIRNLGGIIIIDFIDMEDQENRNKVYDTLQRELKKDRAHTNVLEISELGLVQMTRKRIEESLERRLMTDCPHCSGRGRVKTIETEAMDLVREITRCSVQTGKQKLRIQIRPDIKDWLLKYGKSHLKKLKEENKIQLEFLDTKLTPEILRDSSFEVHY